MEVARIQVGLAWVLFCGIFLLAACNVAVNRKASENQVSTVKQVTSSNQRVFPSVRDCGQNPPKTRPSQLTLSCADGYSVMRHITWTHWGSNFAVGTGVDTWNTCLPDCADSRTWASDPAVIVLSNPVQSKRGMFFNNLTVINAGPRPGPGRHVVFVWHHYSSQ